VLIILGFLTRLAAIPLIMIMIVAIVSTKLPIWVGHDLWIFHAPKIARYEFWGMAHEARDDFLMLLGSLYLRSKPQITSLRRVAPWGSVMGFFVLSTRWRWDRPKRGGRAQHRLTTGRRRRSAERAVSPLTSTRPISQAPRTQATSSRPTASLPKPSQWSACCSNDKGAVCHGNEVGSERQRG
jgi:hypothetical protein